MIIIMQRYSHLMYMYTACIIISLQGRSVTQHRKRISRLLNTEERKREKLVSLGIDYEFPGYRAALQGTAPHQLPRHVHFRDTDE